MAAGKYSMLIEQGATVDIDIVYKDSNNTVVDLTGYNARMKVRSDYADNSPTTYFSLSSSLYPDGTGLILGGVSGTINIFISAVSTSAQSFDTAYYDLELVSGSANPVVTRLLQGTVKLSKEVTR
jgi:hypothetical protein